ncbi:aspartate carbamoyltransferase [Marinicellulosiphila megalodicopiae]|uniref:aspartate carbamoyltransferase n=1 Tax=Marinicellulosiphila megalodicopiae TaxID=2724896 RepID=UPI003BB170A9
MHNPLYQRDVVSIKDFTREDLELIIQTAQKIKLNPTGQFLSGKIIASCFFEASTRTRLSFETAVQRQGGQLIGFADATNTSFGKKGETLSDSIRMIDAYADAIILRHPNEGSARLAAEVAKVPVINGGDGANQHPSQTLLDLFTIFETQNSLDGIKIAFVGDLKYGRTVHSLAQALSLFKDVKMQFIAPDALKMPEYICDELRSKGVEYQIVQKISDAVKWADIIYMTRVQKERFDPNEYHLVASQYVLKAKGLKNAKDNLKILHPLPRIDEICTSVDNTPYAYYFQQAENGLYARQALLALLLNEELNEQVVYAKNS